MGKDNPVFANMVTVSSEFPVLVEYLKSSGFEAYGLDSLEIVSQSQTLSLIVLIC
jgi:hypothetical protein